MNPNVSVLFSVYNGEKYVKQAIESILNQTFKDFELIAIDDGSTDATLSLLMSVFFGEKSTFLGIIGLRE